MTDTQTNITPRTHAREISSITRGGNCIRREIVHRRRVVRSLAGGDWPLLIATRNNSKWPLR